MADKHEHGDHARAICLYSGKLYLHADSISLSEFPGWVFLTFNGLTPLILRFHVKKSDCCKSGIVELCGSIVSNILLCVSTCCIVDLVSATSVATLSNLSSKCSLMLSMLHKNACQLSARTRVNKNMHKEKCTCYPSAFHYDAISFLA